MNFRKLELAGFKSFVDPTELVFQPGITAVVGPNGSGKSNIVDAIKWVLGEQSARSLRGSHMEDVIFNGTEQRPSYGMSEVALTILNDDRRLPIEFHEVSVTRRLYRSGESEYLLNGSPCRLRDIEEIFLDTGIGMQAYSILEQGKIGMLLSAKPEARRFVFEEAAGIMKYRVKKEEAGRRLAATDANLVRIADVLVEIKRTIGSMERMARKAERYRHVKVESDALELLLLSDDLRRAGGAHDEGEAARLALTAGLSAASETLRAAQSVLAEAKDRLILAEEEASRLMEEQRHLDTEVQMTQGKTALAAERRTAAEENRARALADADYTRRRRAEREGSLASAAADAAALSSRLEGVRADEEKSAAEAAGAAGRAEETASAVAAEQQALLDGIRRAGEIAAQREALAERSAALSAEGDRLAAERDEAAGQARGASDTARRITEELSVLSERRRGAAHDRSAALQRAEELRGSLEAMDLRLGTLRTELEGRRERLRTLAELAASLEGYYAGVRAVVLAAREDAGRWRGVCGVVAQLLRTDARFEAALEAAMGAAVQDVVVEDGATAQQAIEYLRAHGAGRATFLPLDLLRARDRSAEARACSGEAGVLGCALDLVRFEPKYVKVAQRFLSGVVVLEDLPSGLRLARGRAPALTLVTLGGEVITAWGSVSGGAPARAAGLLTREREIRELSEEVPRRERELAEAEALRATADAERRRADAQHDRAEATETELAVALSNLRKDYDQAVAMQAYWQGRLSEEGRRVQEWTARLQEAADRARAAEAERSLLDARADEGRSRLAAAQEALSAARAAAERARTRHDDRRIATATIEAQQRARVEEAGRLRAEVSELEGVALALAGQAEVSAARIAECEGSIEAYERQLAESSVARRRGAEALAGAQEERQRGLAAVAEAESAVASAREAGQTRQEALHASEIRQTESGAALRRLEEKLREGFGRAPADAAEVPADFDRDGTAARAAELRTRIAEMGEVSVGALEEFETARKRFDDITREKEDLERARTHLTELLQRINAESRERFLETFRSVRGHFSDIFSDMFGGGEARLELVDENDPLECGIEILARPPGKKLQALSLLSGGERSKTAIALLFSFLRHKPAPFVILDEMDADLDDANIVRFCRVLKSFVPRTQFIIVTHSRITMEIADVLYGVTMEEPGVSRIVSVRMSELVPA